jgi:7-cyano-7-deazaguanine reductase
MAIAEGKTVPFVGPEAIDAAVLETFEYAGPAQEIVTETKEFSPVCPYSGLPDFATLRIVYVPSDRCIELKSLKYYVTSYRAVGIFQEHATGRIAEDLFRVLQPKRLAVTTIYNTRGGFDTTCTVELPERRWRRLATGRRAPPTVLSPAAPPAISPPAAAAPAAWRARAPSLP